MYTLYYFLCFVVLSLISNNLFYRDTLFCYHKASEEFLHRIVSLYVASHYKVSGYLILDVNMSSIIMFQSSLPWYHT